MANKYVDRNNALKRSNNAHVRLMLIMQERKNIPSADYHNEVAFKQLNKNRILTKKERTRIYNKHLKRHGII